MPSELEMANALLMQWRPCNAKIWQFSASLCRLAVRIFRPQEEQDLYLVGLTCRHISGPFSWSDCHLEIIENTSLEGGCPTLILDRTAGFSLQCHGYALIRDQIEKFDLSR